MSEKEREHISMDDLVLKTVGLIPMITQRIEKLESNLRELELNFSKHEGEQSQGIQRTSDHINTLENLVKDLHAETLKQIQNIINDVNEIEKLEGLTSEQKTLILEMKENLQLLLIDYESRMTVKKTAKHYAIMILGYFIQYAMLPVTLTILLLFGFSPTVMKKYKSWGSNEIVVSMNDFNQASVDLMILNRNGCINESDVINWLSTYNSNLCIKSTDKNINNVIYQNAKISYRHFFIWMPNRSSQGYIQIYGKENRKIGALISIVRDK